MKTATDYAGIDYGLGQTNRNTKTGIRFGVIPVHDVCQAWYDSAEDDMGEPHCPECGNEAETVKCVTKQLPNGSGVSVSPILGKRRRYKLYHSHAFGDYACDNCKLLFDSESAFPDTPLAWKLDDGEYKATQGGDDCDIFILESPYFTYAQFCSPCAPGACYLRNPLSNQVESNKAYCFGHDWFDGGKAPYPVYSVETGREIVEVKTSKPCPNCQGSGKDTLARLAKVRQCKVAEIDLAQLHVGNLDIQAGTFDCFRCNGNGKEIVTEYVEQ